jgi:peptide/nickel transport system permease protein
MKTEDELQQVLDVTSIDETALPVGVEPVARSNWQLFRRRFFAHKMAVVSLVILVLLCVACFSASLWVPYSRYHIDTSAIFNAQGPSAKHWFGVGEDGKDLFSQVFYGGEVSLWIGLAVAVISTLLGVFVGALAGYYGTWIDQFLSRLTDLFLIVPELAIIAVAVKRMGANEGTLIIVFAALGWMYIARVVRGQIFSIKEKEFVEAARAAGASDTRIIVRHILPNCIGVIMVNMTLAIAAAVGLEAAISFLGLGLQPPAVSWGLLLQNGEGAVGNSHTFFLFIFPALFLFITIICVNFLGDGLRDAFDPQSKH